MHKTEEQISKLVVWADRASRMWPKIAERIEGFFTLTVAPDKLGCLTQELYQEAQDTWRIAICEIWLISPG